MRRTIEELDLNYFIACRFHDRTAAVIGLGKTVDGDYLSSDDLELLSTIAGYVAIAIENARLYQSLEQKALQIERLKDFSENIVESLRIGVLTVDLEDRIESWNPQLEDLLEIPRSEALRRKLDEVLPRDLAGGNQRASGQRTCFRHLPVPSEHAQQPTSGDQRLDRAAAGEERRAAGPADSARRHHPARAPGRSDGADRKAHVARLAGSGRGARGEHAAGRDLELHPDAREADSRG